MIRKPTRISIPGRRRMGFRFQIDTYCRKVDVIDGKMDGWIGLDEWMDGRMDGRKGVRRCGEDKRENDTLPYPIILDPTLHESPPFRQPWINLPTYFTYLLVRCISTFPFLLLYSTYLHQARCEKVKKKKSERVAIG